jgi:hypothetical protein
LWRRFEDYEFIPARVEAKETPNCFAYRRPFHGWELDGPWRLAFRDCQTKAM